MAQQVLKEQQVQQELKDLKALEVLLELKDKQVAILHRYKISCLYHPLIQQYMIST